MVLACGGRGERLGERHRHRPVGALRRAAHRPSRLLHVVEAQVGEGRRRRRDQLRIGGGGDGDGARTVGLHGDGDPDVEPATGADGHDGERDHAERATTGHAR